MKRPVKIAVWVLAACIISAAGHIFYLNTLKAKEKYPEDEWLSTAPNKRALIIMAHDDDAIGSTGTMIKLTREGWKIRALCFYQQAGYYFKKDSAKNPLRKIALNNAAAIQGFEGVDAIDFNFRKDTMTEVSYMPYKEEEFSVKYQVDSLRRIIASYIETYRPTVIFSLDDCMGGYGRPEHKLIGQLVVEYCRLHKNDSGFAVQKIYQPVFTPSLAESILGKMPVYQAAKKVYNCGDMPTPDVQITISKYGNDKKKAMKAYTTEQNSIQKIWPSYNWYPGWFYFRIFDREFYHVVDVFGKQSM